MYGARARGCRCWIQCWPISTCRYLLRAGSATVPLSGPLTGTVIASTFLGATSRVTVDLGDTTTMAQLSTAAAAELPAGSRVTLTIRPDPVLVSVDAAAAEAEE